MNKFILTNTLRVLIGLVLFGILTGCTKEDLSQCSNVVMVTVVESAISVDPREGSTINDVVLYIFDAEKKFLGLRKTFINKEETVIYPQAGELTIVAWCNTSGGSVDITNFKEKSTLDAGLVELKKNSIKASDSIDVYRNPDDLFYGIVKADNSNQDEHVTLRVSRVVSSMDVTVRKLKEFAGYTDNNYSFVVGLTKTRINFKGQYQGQGGRFIPQSSFNPEEEFITPTFRLFPSMDEVFSVSIYHGDQLVDQVWTDSNGVPFKVLRDKTLHVLIDYSDLSNVVVTIETTKWNEVFKWDVIFN